TDAARDAVAAVSGLATGRVRVGTIQTLTCVDLAAELAARLHQETHDSRYLTSAQRWYEWNWSCLRQSAGLYRNSLGD
ncbi:hypothetical protein ACPXCX_58385, partial [Streptomyces sp. DT225]